MNWAKLILTVATEAWDAWRSRKPDEPAASQRDIAIGVASEEAARREGKIAAGMVNSPRPTAYETHANTPKRMITESAMREECARIKAACPVCAPRTNGLHCIDCTGERMKAFWGVEILPDKLEDTWPGERK